MKDCKVFKAGSIPTQTYTGKQFHAWKMIILEPEYTISNNISNMSTTEVKEM
jgi:hypothetical protein